MTNADNLENKVQRGKKVPLILPSRETYIFPVYLYLHQGVDKNSSSCHMTNIVCIGSIL